jgi:hypothetical protein
MTHEKCPMTNQPPRGIDHEADYHVQDTANGEWLVGSIGVTLVGAVVVCAALVLIGLKRLRPW